MRADKYIQLVQKTRLTCIRKNATPHIAWPELASIRVFVCNLLEQIEYFAFSVKPQYSLTVCCIMDVKQ